MSVKKTAVNLINNLGESADWADIKQVVMKEYKRETGDSTADAIAAVVLCAVFTVSCILWISGQ